MNKYLKILIICFGLVFLLFLSFYLVNKNVIDLEVDNDDAISAKKDLMSQQETNSLGLYHLGVYEVESRDASGKPISYKLIKLRDEAPITLEFMSDEEKAARYFNLSDRIQVLERDASGKITAYKIIKNDSDLVDKY